MSGRVVKTSSRAPPGTAEPSPPAPDAPMLHLTAPRRRTKLDSAHACARRPPCTSNRILAPSERPIQLRCMSLMLSGQSRLSRSVSSRSA